MTESDNDKIEEEEEELVEEIEPEPEEAPEEVEEVVEDIKEKTPKKKTQAPPKKTVPKKPQFTIRLENSKILKGIVETLSSIIDETEFLVTPKEFTITAMDQSRICLLKLTIKKEKFDGYECKKEAKIGLNLDDLEKIMKRCSSDNAIELSFMKKDQKLKIQMQKEGTSRVRTFSLSLLDIDIEEVPMENLLKIDYPSNFVIDSDFLVEAVKDAEIYSEILNIKADEVEGLTFSSSGQIGEMMYKLEKDELIEANLSEINLGSYSLTFLKAILKIASITEKLEMSLRTDHPLKIKFTLLEGGKLSYFLAPRVEEMDDVDDDQNIDEF